MEGERNAVDLSKLCRTCNTERPHLNPLFGRDSNTGLGFDNMLMSCTYLNILETDGFPNVICNDCVDELKVAYRFKQRCENADRYYKQLGLKSNPESSETTEIYNLKPSYDYIEILDDNSMLFICRKCCQGFDTLTRLKNHKLIHLKNGESDFPSLNPLSNDRDCEIIPKNDKNQTIIFKEEEVNQQDVLVLNDEKAKNSHNDNTNNEIFQNEEMNQTIIFKEEEINVENPLDLKEDARRKKNFEKDPLSELWCLDCGQNFDNPAALKRHLARHKCRACGQRFARLPDLKRHLQSHDGLRTRFECDVCGKSYTRRDVLRLHKRTHEIPEVQRRFECDACEKSYLSSYNLQLHKKKTHENAVIKHRFQCDICGKSYRRGDRLRLHRRTHEAGFECNVCGKSCATVDDLQAHRQTHRKKRFRCDVCGKSYCRGDRFRSHRQTHENDAAVRFECDVCGKSYSRADRLHLHKQKHRNSGISLEEQTTVNEPETVMLEIEPEIKQESR